MRVFLSFRAASQSVFPFIIGMLPFAIAFGMFSVVSGIDGKYAILMSATVYAGLAQFIVVNMYSNGMDNLVLLVGFVFLVNLRFSLMGLSLKPYVSVRSKWIECLLSFGLSDEPYAVVIKRFNLYDYELSFHVWTYVLVYFFWVFGTAIGVYASSIIGDPHALGLDFALCAAFVVMLVPMLKQRDSLTAAIFSCLSTLAFSAIGLGEASIVLASLFSLFLAFVIKRHIKTA